MANRIGHLAAVQEMRVFTGKHDLSTPLAGLVVPAIFGPIRVTINGSKQGSVRVLFPLVHQDGQPITRSETPPGFGSSTFDEFDQPYLTFNESSNWDRQTSVHTPELRVEGELIITGEPGQLITSVTVLTEIPVRLI